MQKFGNLDKWVFVKKGQGIEFKKQTTVRLQVSTPAETNWMVGMVGDKKGTFFSLTTGMDVLTFEAQPGLQLIPDQDCRFYRAAEEDVFVPENGKPTFTRISNRPKRNRDLEIMVDKAARNILRNQAILQAQVEREQQEAKRLKEAQEYVDPETGEIIDPSTTGSANEGSVPPPVKVNPANGAAVAGGKSPGNAANHQGGEGDGLSNGNAPADEQAVHKDA